MAPRALSVGLVLPRWSAVGGTEGHARALARWLAEAGHDVTVYCLEARAPAPEGVTVQALPCPPAPRPLRLPLAARAIDPGRHDVVEALGRVPGFDVFRAGGGVHAAWLDASGGAMTRLRARLSPIEQLELRLDRAAARGARRVICNASRPAAEMRRWYGVEEARVVRNGVDTERFRPDGALRRRAREDWGASGRVALFLGSGFRRKGLQVAARAFAAVARQDDRFVVIGRDAHAERHLKPVRRLLGAQLVVMGERDDPERWLPGADATILPTRYDPAANATLEAMACGVPPVTSARDGNAELSPDPSLVVEDPDDVEGFARALRYAWEARPGEACRAEAELWPHERTGREMERIFRELCDA